MFNAIKRNSQVKLEEEILVAERLATSAAIAKLKSDYDADLRKDHPDLRIKFQYGYVLCCSASRGQIRRGIELLEELETLLAREIEIKQRGASFSSPSVVEELSDEEEEQVAAILRSKSDASEMSNFIPAPGYLDEDYVVLSKQDCQLEGGAPQEEEEAKEEEADESETFPNDEQYETQHVAINNSELLDQVKFYKAVGYYRLGEYSQAIQACDALLQQNEGHVRASGLKTLSYYGMVSRNAVGFLFTVGVAVPAAYLWHRNGSSSTPGS